jgi:alpha-1,2-mannosyltransferase
VSGTTVTPDAQAAAGGSVPPGRQWVRRWPSPATVMIVLTTALAIAVRLYQLSRPAYLYGLTEYDDGPYFGSAVHLVQGLLPYRDFVLVQPPGITLLMTPVALYTKIVGTAHGIGAGRVVTALAGAAGTTVAGLLVRHRGAVAVLIAGGVVAVFPDSVAAAHTVLVEPWLVLFCLIGAVAVFDRDRLASNRRIAWGGVAFGFAGAVEAWAVIPVLVMLALCMRQWRRAALFAAGVAAGFLVPVLPFAAIAPKRFFQSLITAQVGPRASDVRVPVWFRLKEMTGLTDAKLPGHANIFVREIYLREHSTVVFTMVVLLLLSAGTLIAATLISRRLPTTLEWFAVVTMVIVGLMFLWPSQFHYHFVAFLAPFLGLAIALGVSSLVELLAGRGAHARWPARTVACLVVVIVTIFSIFQFRAESTLKSLINSGVVARVSRAIPPGSCVASDEVSLLLISNRFISNVPGCSAMIDGLGTDLALSGGLKPGTGAGRNPAVQAVWMQAFQHAQFIWLSKLSQRRVAWFPALQRYFTAHFTAAITDPRGDVLYKRK